MRNTEKQILYNLIDSGHRSIENLSGKHLKEFKTHWLDKGVAMPPIDFDIKIRNEIRRREVQTGVFTNERNDL